MVFETVDYCLLMSCDSLVVKINNLDQLLQSYIAYVIFLVGQKLAEDIYA
jgi:hypothetical protein